MVVWLLTTLAWAHPMEDSWTLATPDVESVQIAAVQRALRAWPAFAIGLASKAILADDTTCSTITWSLTDELSLQCDDGEYVRPLEGVHRFTDPKGRAVSSKLSIREDGLKLTWSGKDGRRTDTWTQQGDTLTLDVRISAPELPRAIVWTVVYQRRAMP